MRSIRNIAVGLLVRNGHVLVEEGFDHVRNLNFYRAIGGGIEFGETAEAALRREFREELGCELESATLLGVIENLFEFEGAAGHEVAHIFSVTSSVLSAMALDDETMVLDTGSSVRWVPIGALTPGRPPLFPEGATDHLARSATSS